MGIIDLNRSPAQRNAIATRRALKRRGVEPEGIEIVPDPPANHPNGWFEVHSQEIEAHWGKTTYFVYKKIGSFFPFLQPENAKFEFNLAVQEQRLCASLFTSLAAKEKLGKTSTSCHQVVYSRARTSVQKKTGIWNTERSFLKCTVPCAVGPVLGSQLVQEWQCGKQYRLLNNHHDICCCCCCCCCCCSP